ncbi:MAG: Ribosome-recycling factor [Parcubacteria group bacterium GW2011_GWF2_46_8]|nr:MAG: Ribosome-recycling factor [Parcubacteria group bacterium GW2011_GWF2_46_8]
MHPFIEAFHKTWLALIDEFKIDIASLRTNRITPALVEDVGVESYGSQYTLKELGSIAMLPPNLLVIDPWDKTTIPAIEKGIQLAQIGVMPSNDGTVIKLVFPPLTEEKRLSLVKVLKEKFEESRIKFRQQRDGVRKQIQDLLEKKEINEDELYDLNEALQKQVDEFNKTIDTVSEKKEKEIMTI